MQNFPSILLEDAVNEMASLPGIGKKTALRLVLHLLKRESHEVRQFANAFTTLHSDIKYCQSCHNVSDAEICETASVKLQSICEISAAHVRITPSKRNKD